MLPPRTDLAGALRLLRRGAAVALRIAAGALAALLVLVGLWTIGRGTPIHRIGAVDVGDTPPAVGDPRFRDVVALHAGAVFSAGNAVELLADGDGTYPRLWADLRAARHTIAVQLYYARPGHVADTLAAILAARARAGVVVRVLLDDFGAARLPPGWDARLRVAGVRVLRHRPVRWRALGRSGNRSHVRALIVDGAVGYTGGFGLADYWLGDGRADGAWRETNVRVAGPAVAPMHAAFLAAWAEASGELLAGTTLRTGPDLPAAGAIEAAVVHTVPSPGSTAAERLLALSIGSARHRLWITSSYFVPDDDFLRFLGDAVRRGVDVRVLTAGPDTDVETVRWASRARYARLLRDGVRLWEYGPSMMHAKTLVADGTWAIVGSMNFDNRSLALNEEMSVLVRDPAVGARLDSLFLADLARAQEIRAADFAARPWHERVRERLATLVARLL